MLKYGPCIVSLLACKVSMLQVCLRLVISGIVYFTEVLASISCLTPATQAAKKSGRQQNPDQLRRSHVAPPRLMA